MEILVTGASGYVGSSLMEELATDYTVAGTYAHNSAPGLLPMDVSSEQEVESVFSTVAPRLVIHSAGVAGIADENPELGRAVNVEGTRNIVRAAQAIGARVVFLSSAAVFNGQEGLFAETDSVGSQGEYGRTKIEAEQIVEQSGLSHLIIRPSLVVGAAPRRIDGTYTGRVAESIRKKQPQEIDGKWRVSPTLTADVAAAVAWWFNGRQEKTSLLHIGTREVTTQLELARRISAATDNDPGLFTESTGWSPSSNVLDTSRARRLGLPLHTLDEIVQITARHLVGVTHD